MEHSAVKKRRRWWLAGFLSFLVPGLGQVYNGQETKGLFLYVVLSVWGGIVLSMVSYFLKPPFKPANITIICLLALVSMILWIVILIDAIRTARRISGDYALRSFNRWYIYILVIVVIRVVDFSIENTIVKNSVIKAYRIPSQSMQPTIMAGDYLLCDQSYYLSNNPARGDLVIFKYSKDETKDFIKRIIGVPKDKIQIIDDALYINDKKIESQYAGKYRPGQEDEADIYQENAGKNIYRVLDHFKKHENFGPLILPDGEYFVMGDSRDHSMDSRHWGTVKRHQITGRPVFIYLSYDMKIPAWNIFGKFASIRFSRIGKVLE